MSKIGAITSKGQITLPINWRKQNNVNQVLITESDNKLIIEPIDIRKYNRKNNINTGEEIIFDANRDNNGKGVPASEVIKMIEEINEQA